MHPKTIVTTGCIHMPESVFAKQSCFFYVTQTLSSDCFPYPTTTICTYLFSKHTFLLLPTLLGHIGGVICI